MKLSVSVMAIVVILLLGTQASSDVLWGVGTGTVDDSSMLYRIDDYDTAPTLIEVGETGEVLFDIAYNPIDGELYAISRTRLYRVDQVTAQLTTIGTSNFGFNSFDIRSDGTAYIAGDNTGDGPGKVAIVDLSDGSVNELGPIGFAPAGDIAFDADGTLYVTTNSEHLGTIDPLTGAGTIIGPLNILASKAYGADIDSTGTLYASGFPDNFQTNFRLFTVDKTTGNATLVGEIANSGGIGINGLAFVTPIPEPSSFVVAAGAFLLVLRRRRR